MSYSWAWPLLFVHHSFVFTNCEGSVGSCHDYSGFDQPWVKFSCYVGLWQLADDIMVLDLFQMWCLTHSKYMTQVQGGAHTVEGTTFWPLRANSRDWYLGGQVGPQKKTKKKQGNKADNEVFCLFEFFKPMLWINRKPTRTSSAIYEISDTFHVESRYLYVMFYCITCAITTSLDKAETHGRFYNLNYFNHY